MAALIEAAKESDFPAEVILVVSNIPDVKGLERAKALGVPTLTINHKNFPDKAAFEQAIDPALRQAGAELVCLAGFMRILSDDFVTKWHGRLLNIHPSLLPAFKGLHTHERAIESRVKEHGCTVHHVVADLDAGPIIAQARVPVLADDTAETLAARVLAEENRIYPEALAKIARSL